MFTRLTLTIIWLTLSTVGSTTHESVSERISRLNSEASKEVIFPARFRDDTNIFPEFYDVIAPFPLGTREIGADPLESFGGIRKIPRADKSTYPSDLYYQSKVGWTKITTATNGAASVQWSNSTIVNWDLINDWAGLAGLSFQGWAVGDITIPATATYEAYCWSVSRFFIDNNIYSGDNYGFGMISTPVYLTVGRHTLYVPFSSSVSASWGCILSPLVNTTPLSFGKAGDDLMPIPDLISYANTVTFTSPYMSLVFSSLDPLNTLNRVTVHFNSAYVQITQQNYPSIAPGQTVPINFMVQTTPMFTSCNSTLNVSLSVTFDAPGQPLHDNIILNCKTWPVGSGGYIFTFPDFDDSIHYAAVRPPLNPCPIGCSVLFSLHGAGVISGPNWANFYKSQAYSWVLLPTNRRFYGFDWQGPGMKNAIFSLNYLAEKSPGVPAPLVNSFKANQYRVIFAGHSMGGHGCWLLSTHFPDRALAVAPASGWINFPLYIPYFTRVGSSLANPFLLHILDAAIAEDTPDTYAPHLVNIPVIIRFGGNDDNVPPFHMRRMGRLVNQLNRNASWTEVSEVAGEGHWWNDVVDGLPMQNFFDRYATLRIVPLPLNFTVLTMNPATSESKGGIKILQLQTPYRGGYIKVERSAQNPNVWTLSIQNVRRFGFLSEIPLEKPAAIVIGTTVLGLQNLPAHYFFDDTRGWVVVNDDTWTKTERHPATYGPLWQVIQGPLIIVFGTTGSQEETSNRYNYALYLANTLYYRGRYAPIICPDTNLPVGYDRYNLILLGGPTTNALSQKLTNLFPVQFAGRVPRIANYEFRTPSTGIAFLAPGLSSDTLVAVVEGTDEEGFRKAMLLVPTSSGVTMPDYAVAGPNWGWAGAAGLLAAGFWDNQWKYSEAIGYLSSDFF